MQKMRCPGPGMGGGRTGWTEGRFTPAEEKYSSSFFLGVEVEKVRKNPSSTTHNNPLNLSLHSIYKVTHLSGLG
jgi:hypothetical protein